MTIIATRCPACGTTFEMKPEQLALADGWVRCGRCSEVFDGVASRCGIPGVATTGDTDALDVEAEAEADDAPTSVPPPRQADPWSGMPSLDLDMAPAQAPSTPPLPEAMAPPAVSSASSPDAPDRPGDHRRLPPAPAPVPPPVSADERAVPAAAERVPGVVPGALFQESAVAEPSTAPAKRRGWSKGVRLALVLVAVAILLVLAVRWMYGQRGLRVSMPARAEVVAAASSPMHRRVRGFTAVVDHEASVIERTMALAANH